MKNWPTVGILLVAALSGCVSNQSVTSKAALLVATNSPPVKVFADWVILSPEAAEDSHLRKQGFAPFWSPSTNEVNQAIGRIRDFLASDSAREGYDSPGSRYLLPLIQESLPETLCQAVGVTRRGQRAILLNCMPESRFRSTAEWRYRFMRWHDAGPRWWSVAYFPEPGTFSPLRIDLGF